MCAHIGQNRDIYRRVYMGYILTRTPSPFSAGSSWGAAIEKNFFYFLNPLSTRSDYTSVFIFLIFARNLSEVWIENILNFILVILISKFFLFFQNIASTRQVFTRYSLSAFIFSHFILIWFWFRIYFISFTIFDSDYNLGFCVFRFYISTRFYSLNFTRIKLCRFYALTLRLFISLTLLLVINKHLCLW